MGSRGVFVQAFAKINLTLEVIGKRADGYHELASIMQSISLCDTLRFEDSDGTTVTLDTDAPALLSEDNLVLQAARLLAGEDPQRKPPGARIELRKAVPTQAGLGGGSGDCATTLATLNALWALGHSVERLRELGARLGSDVPFMIDGGTARIAGRGEHVYRLPDAAPCWLVLAKPAVDVSTGAVFRCLTPSDYAPESATSLIEETIRAGEPLPLAEMRNTLEESVMALYPAVRVARDRLASYGAQHVRMSGSGPTLFAPFDRLADAHAVYTRALAGGMAVWLCHTLSRAAVAASRSALRPWVG